MKNVQRKGVPFLKVNHCIELPIQKASPDGIIKNLGFANDQQIYFTKGNQVYFLDMEGNLGQKSSKKYGRALVPDQKTVLSYDYARVDNLFEVTFDYHEVSAGKMGHSLQTFKVKIKKSWHMMLSHQRQLFLITTEFGLHITHYSPKAWEELAFISQDILDKYQADFKKIILSKNLVVLVSKDGQVTLYDYVSQQVTSQFTLPQAITDVDVSPCGHYIIAQQASDQQVVFLRYETQEIAFTSPPKVKSFDVQGDFLGLVYQDKSLEVYNISDFACLGYNDYFKNSLMDQLWFKFHDTQPQFLVSDSDRALVFSWGENDPHIALDPSFDEEKYAVYYQSIELWDATTTDQTLTKIKEVGKEDKRQKILIQRHLEHRYQSLIQNDIITPTLKALRDLPTKWPRMNTFKKAKVLKHWPHKVPFFTTAIDLKAKLRVDRWRDSHYTHQLRNNFPGNIAQIKGITSLDLTHQQFEKLPPAVFEMKALEVLNLEDNNLRVLPEEILKLKKLKVLILKQNYGLEELPDLGQLVHLEEIDFKYTRFSSLPESFFTLKHLKKINTIHSELDRDTKIIRRLLEAFPTAEITTSARQAVEMEDNVDMDEYKGQEKINIDSFELNYLPASLFAADQVKELIIDCPHLKELPDTFDQLATLEKLHIEAQSVDTLPHSITQLPHLKELKLEGHFETLPPAMKDLVNLETLILEHGQFKELPAALAQLPKLKVLKADYLNIAHLNASMGAMHSLETLVLENVFIEGGGTLQVDPALLALKNLKHLSINLRNGELDDSVFNLPQSIQELSLKVWHNPNQPYNSILSFQKLMNHFHQVTKLTLGGIKLTSTKDALQVNTTLKTMTTRDVVCNRLPDDVYNLQALNYLTLFDAQLEELNSSIYQCHSLEYLRLSNFQQATIPAGIEQMKKLKKLGFERSKIASLPDGIFELQQLERLCLGECPLFSDKSYKAKIKRKIKGLKVGKEWYA